MKKIFLLLSTLALLVSCSEEKPIVNANSSTSGYSEVLKSNPALFKTSKLNLDNAVYDLEYVRDQKYYDGRDFCYGHLVTDAVNFRDILSSFTVDYDPDDVWEIKLLTEGPSLCSEEEIIRDNAKFLIVYYKNANDVTTLDYVDVSSNIKKTYTIGDVRASVAMNFLMNKSGISLNPSVISIRNGDFNFDSVTWDEENDYIANSSGPIPPDNPTLQQPGSGSNDGCNFDCYSLIGYDCVYRNYDQHCKLTDSDYACAASFAAVSLYNSTPHQQLGSDLFAKFNILYDFRDNFLTSTAKGRRYILDYYTLHQLKKDGHVNSMSMSQMIDLAELIIKDSGKLVKLINHNSNGNVVLYSAAEANDYKALLSSIRSLSTHTRWTTIIDNVLDDVDYNQGRTISQIVADMN